MKITGAMSSFFMPGIILAYHARLPANMDAICSRKPSNEHDLYPVAVLDNIGEGATRGLRLPHSPLHCNVQGHNYKDTMTYMAGTQ